MAKHDAVLAEALTWVGAPYRHQGRDKFGVDCVGLVVCVAKAVNGWNGYDVTAYPRHGDALKLVEHFAKGGGVRKRVADRQPGDILVISERLFPVHCGILGENDTLIHAHMRRRRVAQEPLANYDGRLVACFEVP